MAGHVLLGRRRLVYWALRLAVTGLHFVTSWISEVRPALCHSRCSSPGIAGGCGRRVTKRTSHGPSTHGLGHSCGRRAVNVDDVSALHVSQRRAATALRHSPLNCPVSSQRRLSPA